MNSQLITELISNLLNEQHAEAWLDLAPSSSSTNSNAQSGERQRVAGQLLAGLESGCVLLAGALQQQQQPPPQQRPTGSGNLEDFQKVTEHVYVAIQSFALDLKQAGSSQRLQVTFPSQTSLLGSRWMNSDQRFTLNLQASNLGGAPAGGFAADASGGDPQAGKFLVSGGLECVRPRGFEALRGGQCEQKLAVIIRARTAHLNRSLK